MLTNLLASTDVPTLGSVLAVSSVFASVSLPELLAVFSVVAGSIVLEPIVTGPKLAGPSWAESASAATP